MLLVGAAAVWFMSSIIAHQRMEQIENKRNARFEKIRREIERLKAGK